MKKGSAKRSVEEIVEELATPITESKGFELVKVEFIKEGSNWYLRVYIDKPGGITLDDCQLVSEQLSDELDRLDPIKQRYFLEVSSPGLERTLKTDRDFERFKGSQVELKVYQQIDGKRVFEGELMGLRDNKIVVRIADDRIMEFERDKVALVKRTVKF